MKDWNGVVSEFYQNFNPAIQKLNDKALITQAKNDNRNHLGIDPSSGAPVCAYIGKYGPVVQIGEGKTSKFIKIEEPYMWNTLTLNDLPNLNKFPKLLGQFETHDIYLKKGKFGLYLTCNEKNYKLLSTMDENMSYEDALECINPTKKEDGEKKDATSTNKLIKTIGKYSIRNGPYGHYILYDKIFYSIPKTTVPEDLTEEMCKVIIKLEKEKPKKPYKKKET
jgi:DNA topoisomerase-1